MAKGKGGKSQGYISAGINSNVGRKTRNAIRRAYMESGERQINQRAAFDAGKNVMITIENPNKEETNKRFIRVPARDAGWKRSR